MRTRKDTVTYKLPAAFVDANRDALDAIDWKTSPTITLDLGWPHNPVLEAVPGRGTTIVRPATIKSANLIRRSVVTAEPDQAETNRVLASRNPPQD